MQTTLNVSLPSSLKDFVKQQAEEKDYGTPSDYIRALIREKREKQRHIEEKKLENMLLEGIASGFELFDKEKCETLLRNTLQESQKQ